MSRATETWWTFRIFFCFLLGGGEGGVRGARKGAGVGFLLKIAGGGGVLPEEGGGWLRGLEGVCEECGGGRLNIFFRGRNSHQEDSHGCRKHKT